MFHYLSTVHFILAISIFFIFLVVHQQLSLFCAFSLFQQLQFAIFSHKTVLFHSSKRKINLQFYESFSSIFVLVTKTL